MAKMMRDINISIVLICVLAFSLTGYAKDFQSINNDYFVEFSVKSKNELIGQQTYLGLSFASFLQGDGSVIAEIQVNKKLFTAYIPLNARVRVECVFIKDGKPAKIEMQDVVTLSLLYNILQGQLDRKLLIDEKLNRFIGYLIEFHPIGEYFDNSSGIKGKEEEDKKVLIKPFEYNSICKEMGGTIKGVYIIEKEYQDKYGGDNGCGDENLLKKNQVTIVDNKENPDRNVGGHLCTAEKLVGPPDSGDCFGRCGDKCGFAYLTRHQHAFTQECFNHDLCALATGLKGWGSIRAGQPCRNEALDAKDGYFNEPDCQIYFINESPTGSILYDWPTISVDIKPSMSLYINLDSIRMTVDNSLVNHNTFVSDKDGINIYYNPINPLKEGNHTVDVSAETLRGRISGEKNWSFTVQNGDTTTPWIGNWLQINFLSLDDNGVWCGDDPGGIGLSAVVSENKWIETDYNNGCALTYSFTIDKDLNYQKKGVAISKDCDFYGINPMLLDESGKLEFYDNNSIMINFFDMQPGDDIVAFKWMRQ